MAEIPSIRKPASRYIGVLVVFADFDFMSLKNDIKLNER
jgi:hypothetical protein